MSNRICLPIFALMLFYFAISFVAADFNWLSGVWSWRNETRAMFLMVLGWVSVTSFLWGCSLDKSK